ncbi:MAG: sodium:proton antiporter [Gammaproteobacteria bacterium RIFCSPHIGHO2_12_FULL_41_15]|nr:MAG: sodium:proton antiporter [Gammaproteobacteria bacterium RIFCSPHIGHO2_12_FULL_41_15]
MHDSMIFSLFIIFTGAAIMSTLALYTSQSLLVAYMLLGAIIGPSGLRWVTDADMIKHTGDIGILFLLFLLGLHLPPQKLLHMLRKITLVGVISSFIFAVVGYLIGLFFGYTQTASIVIGVAMMFSSTIIGIKLLPTTVLHHQHTGEVMISVLLFQDLIAIIVLLLLHGASTSGFVLSDMLLVLVALPLFLLFAFAFERIILLRLFSKFDRIREYMFLLSIAWCLALSQLAAYVGLTDEIGAFIAGVALASSTVALYIAESLKPVRDFFLVMFFFSVGASFNLAFLSKVIIPALVLSVLMLALKPAVYGYLLRKVSESDKTSLEVGFRLGQVSEFSLIISYVALEGGLISQVAAYLIQATTIITFVVSSYLVVMRYPTPIAMSDKLRRD